MSDPTTSATATPASPTPPTSPPPAAPTASEFRFGADAPEWARGKTAAEVLSISDQLYRAVAAPPPPSAAPTHTERPWQQPPTATAPAMPTDDDWIQRPGEAFQKAAQAFSVQNLNPTLTGMAATMAEFAKETVRREDERLWAKYGPEIETLVAPVDVTVRKVDTFRMAADIVRGRHFAELAAEAQQARLAGLPAAERATGGSSAVPVAPADGFDFEKLSPVVKEKWKAAGITGQTIHEWCGKIGVTPQQFLEMTLNEKVIGETLEGTQMVRPEALGIPAGGYRS